MNILLVSYEFPPEMATGGIGFYMSHLAHVLNGAGHNIIVFSASSQHDQLTIVKRDTCLNYLIPAKGLDLFRIQVLEIFRSLTVTTRIDLIESPEVGACALRIKEEYPEIPLIVKLHSPGVLITKVSNYYQSFPAKLRFVLGALLRGRIDLGYWARRDKNRNADPEFRICNNANLIISPSVALKKWAVGYWKINESKISILPNPFTAEDELYGYPIAEREKQICFVGKLTILKGMISLTPAILRVLERNPDYKMVFAGRDEAVSSKEPSMQALMEEKLKPVLDRVRFLGVSDRDVIRNLYKSSLICVVPSLWENYPTVVLEAMSAGCVVAASQRGGIPELITHKKTGILFNPFKPTSIYKSIQYLIENDAKREIMAKNARESIVTSAKTVGTQIVNTYNRILKNEISQH